ncbi:MAG: helix-turn-helix transcriptional regulator [Lachnospiraceae bacterium]|nr:helix-turn-helix transcriptional regulator [Lachnospiraceae bacterium]
MNIGKNIKEIRKKRGYTLEEVAEKLGISISTLSRYESSQITKIPLGIVDGLCTVLGTTTQELMGNSGSVLPKEELPSIFDNAEEAMAFVIKLPILAAYGGYDVKNMSDETVIQFANEILGQLKLVSYKYKTEKD